METTLRNRIFILAIFLFVVLLVSCSETNTNTSLATNNEIPSSITPNETPSPFASSTQFSTTTPTFDPVDATFAAQRATQAIEEAETERAAFATLDARNTSCNYGYDYPFNFHPQDSFFSTNSGGSWAVIECVLDETNSSKGYTEVVNHDGSKVFRIPYSFPLPDDSDILVGLTIEPNGKYLYLIPGCAHCAVFPDPSSAIAPMEFGAGVALYRLDLSSGNFTTVVPFIKHDYYVDISISPDTQYLVYSDIKDGNNIFIKNLTNGTKKTVQLENNYILIGSFTWSPDNNYLIFVAAIDGWENDKAGFSLFRLDLKTMLLHTLVLNDSRKLVPWLFDYPSQPTWIDSNTLSLGSIAETSFTNDWSININTGQVIPIPTPTSTP
jgi:WD40 repeat protein